MPTIERLIELLERRYKSRTRESARLFQRAQKVMIKGGSHTLRLPSPYPFFVRSASGANVVDADGNEYLDFWQGHFANILGHNPRGLEGPGPAPDPADDSLHTGFEGEAQIELAELLLKQLGWKNHKVRFTTSGTLATMYAVMLAQGWTGRDEILKIGGGWHGASPLLLKGVKFDPDLGFQKTESAGVPAAFAKRILTTRYNDSGDLERILRKRGDRIACFILEPFLGAGGFIPATPEYLENARRWTAERGIVLIFDEIISGFRFGPTGLQRIYGIEPDLSTFGKVIGGGHAVAAVIGKSGILECVQAPLPPRARVQFSGGTFSAHPQYMRAGVTMLRYLIRNAAAIYPRIGAMGERLRQGIETAFEAEGLRAKCTGGGSAVLGGSSLFVVNFPLTRHAYTSSEDVLNPRFSDVRLKEDVLRLALMTLGVHVVHGGGAVATAHQDADIDRAIAAYGETARLFKRSGLK
jgi:glutamate-1-semialdehyde 2,1-aminomutase